MRTSPSALPEAPDAEDFRALARSSPWRFRRLHLTAYLRDTPIGPTQVAEAWLDRDASRVVVRTGRRVEVAEGVPYGGTGLDSPSAYGEYDSGTVRENSLRRRPDGLVIERPEFWEQEAGDPMWGNDQWTAMLDPEELTAGVEISDVRAVDLHGRSAWSAVCRPVLGDLHADRYDGYEPRCSCCPLLDSTASRILEDGPDTIADPTAFGGSPPTTYLVHLDVETSVVLDITPLDGETGSSLSVRIHEVDGALADLPEGHRSKA